MGFISRFWLILGCFMAGISLHGQTFSVSGQVLDDHSHEPVADVSVYLGENYATLTDEDGKFFFESVKPGQYDIHTNLMGYKPLKQTILVDRDVKKVHFHLESVGVRQDTVYIVARDFLDLGARENTLSSDNVDKDFLEKNQGNTFSNTLQKIPGVTSMNTGVGIAKPVIRGMTFNRVIVNDQGIKQEGQQWGADHGLEIDQYGVERVEVVKGPTSLLYGSDGISGVVNIKPPVMPREGSLSAEAVSFYRSNNHALGVSAGAKGNFRNHFFRLRYTAQNFGDYRVPADSFVYNSYVLPIYDRSLKNTAGQERNLSGSFGFVREWGLLRLSVSNFNQHSGFFPGAIGIPRSYQLEPDGDTRNIDLPRQEINHFKAILNGRLLVREKNMLEFDFGFQDNDRREMSNPHNHGTGPILTDSLAHGLRLQTLSGNLRFHQKVSEHLQMKYGATFQHQQNARKGFEFLIPDYEFMQGGAYAMAEYELEAHMTFSGGLRFDYGTVTADSFTTPIYQDPTTIIGFWERTPYIQRDFKNISGALGWSWYPSDEFNLKINLGRAFRMPTAPELTENGVHHGTFRHERGDPDLDPETGYQLDIGLAYRKKDFLWKITPFFNYFDNYIYLRPSGSFSLLPDAGQVYQYNQATALHTGFEALVEYHLIEPLHISTGAEYVFNLNLDTGLPLPFTPPFSLSSQIDYTIEKTGKVFRDLNFSLEHRWTHAQNRTDRNENPTPGYQLFHIGIGGKLKFGSQHIALNFRAQNLLNKQYMNHLSRYRILNLPEQGRNFMVTLRIPLEILKGVK